MEAFKKNVVYYCVGKIIILYRELAFWVNRTDNKLSLLIDCYAVKRRSYHRYSRLTIMR